MYSRGIFLKAFITYPRIRTLENPKKNYRYPRSAIVQPACPIRIYWPVDVSPGTQLRIQRYIHGMKIEGSQTYLSTKMKSAPISKNPENIFSFLGSSKKKREKIIIRVAIDPWIAKNSTIESNLSTKKLPKKIEALVTKFLKL